MLNQKRCARPAAPALRNCRARITKILDSCDAFMNTLHKSRTHLHIWAAGRRVEQSRDAAFHLETEHHTCREKLDQSLHHFGNTLANTHLLFHFVIVSISSGISLTSSSPPFHPAHLSASGDWTGTQKFDSESVKFKIIAWSFEKQIEDLSLENIL